MLDQIPPRDSHSKSALTTSAPPAAALASSGLVGRSGLGAQSSGGPVLSRRWFLALTGAGTWGCSCVARSVGRSWSARRPIPGGTLMPELIPKFVTPLLVPPVMPRAGMFKLAAAGTATTTRSR